jgi:hypothetical protein
MGFLLAAALVTLSGIVTDATAPLPGVTVTVTGVGEPRTVYTDADGRYALDLPPGSYDLRYQLPSFELAERSGVTLQEAAVVLPAQKLELDAEAFTTISCSFQRCTDEGPQTVYDDPLCSDYALNDSLMDAARLGDDSASRFLRTRYDGTLSLAERHRIGDALDDAAITRDMLREADLCVRFPRDAESELTPEWLEWCAARNLPPQEHWDASFDALVAVSDDPRSRDLLRKALESTDSWIASLAVVGLAEQKDVASLPAIERVLARFDDDLGAATALANFQSEAADAIARKYLEEHEQAEYDELRRKVEP